MAAVLQPEEFQKQMKKVWSARRKVVTIGGGMNTERLEVDFHSHQKAQLLLSLSGVITCEVRGGIWIVPANSAIFIPGRMKHRFTVAGNVQCYITLIAPRAAREFSASCSTLTVTPLLKELIVRSSQSPLNYRPDSTAARVADLLLDELASAPSGDLHLPMPSDERLRSIFQSMMEKPSHRGTIESWAKCVGVGKRTLARVIAAETGMSFGRWRQQLNIVLALQWLANGATVKQVAFDLGYESVGSFVTMFRKTLGDSPARYMSARSRAR